MGGPPTPREAGTSTRPPRRSPSPSDASVLALLGLLSVALLGLLLWRASRYDLAWTGVDGLDVLDQMQYVAWIQEAAGHGLARNPYQLGHSARSFLHPGIALSGALAAAGVAPNVAYLLWKPVAVVALFLAVRTFLIQTVPGVWPRRVALGLALLTSPLLAALGSRVPGLGIRELLDARYLGQDLWPVFWLWGYPFAALAVAALPACLVAYARDGRDGRTRAWAPALALLCSWLQPWQGATLLGVLVVAEATARREKRNARALVACLTVGAAPLVYYALLAKLDPSWASAGEANMSSRPYSALVLCLLLLPLALPAVLAYRRRRANFLGRALRAWPLVGLALFCLINYAHVGTYAPHALQGLGIPLAALAVIGFGQSPLARSHRLPSATAVAALAGLVVLPVTLELDRARDTVVPGAPYMLESGDRAALQFLRDDRRPGGVLAPAHIGLMIPAKTRRPTWVGALSWTPDFRERAQLAHRLFDAPDRPLRTLGLPPPEHRLDRGRSVALVRESGTRFVLVDCASKADLGRSLKVLVASTRRFGCATILELR